jgi:hypothetical protein
MALNIGLPQTAPDIEDKITFNKLKAKVAETRDYLSTLDPKLQDVCKMANPYCARFALSTDCEDNADKDEIKFQCAAACQTCELLANGESDLKKAEQMWILALMDYQNSKASKQA